ncbi:UNVERIFIED_CONTAM: D-tyrosyl-tRNA(Tyr) deacylase [Siphonaria sp. JEL0065]|nr:D-tyrosyl-tRNA(Tyr) deacylase [Siphonaria sp. JEL0065]
MRAVIQRVKKASVTVGITQDDTESDADYIAKKITSLKLWPNAEGLQWKLNVKDAGYEILSVSQFTLYAVTSKGAKPDFHYAMKSTDSFPFYVSFLERLKALHDAEKVKDGEFGAMMDVGIVNDGPVTIILDSKDKK